MIPGFMFAFGSFQPTPLMTWLPMLGQHIMISDIVRGQPPDAAAATALTPATLVAGVALLAASTLLTRECVVRRQAG